MKLYRIVEVYENRINKELFTTKEKAEEEIKKKKI